MKKSLAYKFAANTFEKYKISSRFGQSRYHVFSEIIFVVLGVLFLVEDLYGDSHVKLWHSSLTFFVVAAFMFATRGYLELLREKDAQLNNIDK